MNNKSLLLAIFATAFSGMNLVATEEAPVIITEIVKATYQDIQSKKIKNHCVEFNTDLCKELLSLMNTLDSIDLDAMTAIKNSIKEEINAKNITNQDLAKALSVIIPAINEELTQTILEEQTTPVVNVTSEQQ
jgi:hypothetical protein